MTHRSNHPHTTTHRPQARAMALRAAANLPHLHLTTAALIAAALILVLVLITGQSSAEYGFV